ncbi:MAG: hypothetical protein ACLFV7_12465 [Phycisphaerae bacterium]
MDSYQTIAELVELAAELGVEVRRAPAGDPTSHPGGALVKLKGREVLFLEPAAGVADQLAVLAATLKGRPELEDRYLKPSLREAIENESI